MNKTSTEIDLRYNFGYETISKGKVHTKGYLFNKGRLYQGNSLVELFNSITNVENLESLLKTSYGIFYVVLRINGKLCLASDITRTFPLFYFLSDQTLHISDDAFFLKKKFGLAFDRESCSEFLRVLYVTGENTLLKELNQLQAGEIAIFENGRINRKFYNTYLVTKNEIFEKEYSDLLSEYLQILENITERLIVLANGNSIVLPLSGGYDSRLLATLLKKHGHKKIICYTYGKPDSPEVKTSREVANALGFDWNFVEYNKTIVTDYINEMWFYEFFRYEFNFVSTIHLQDVFAFKFLVEKGIIPRHAIIVPGHSGDFLGGSHLRKIPVPDRNGINASIIAKHFVLNEDISLSSTSSQKLEVYVEKNAAIPDIQYYSIDENWNVKERQSKFIVNSNKAYEYFGFRHAIPLWDLELVEFFRKVPLKLKTKQNLYEDGAESLFKAFNVDFPKLKKVTNFYLFPKIRFFAEKIFPQKLKKSLRDLIWADVNNLKVISAPMAQSLNKKYSLSEFHGIAADWSLKNAEKEAN